jgi:hypothetical protein
MNNVVFRRADHKVAGLNRPAFLAEYSVLLPYAIVLSKAVASVMGQKQKTNEAGQLLYKYNVVVDEFGQENFDEVTESQKAVAWEEVVNKYVIDGEVVEVPGQVATEYVDLEPVLIDDVVYNSVSFQDNPSIFEYEEVLEAKKAALQKANLRKLVHYDEDFNLEGFSTDLAAHAANMGDGILALHPSGSCRTEKIALGSAVKTVQLYLEAAPDVKVEVGSTANSFVEFKDGVAQLPSAASEVYIRFTNTTDKYRDIFAFGILV